VREAGGLHLLTSFRASSGSSPGRSPSRASLAMSFARPPSDLLTPSSHVKGEVSATGFAPSGPLLALVDPLTRPLSSCCTSSTPLDVPTSMSVPGSGKEAVGFSLDGAPSLSLVKRAGQFSRAQRFWRPRSGLWVPSEGRCC